MSRYSRPPVALAAAACAALTLAASLTGCDALGKLGAASHYPAGRNFTIDGRVTTVIIEAGSGSVDVTAANRSTVGVSQQASYSTAPPAARRVLSGTTLTLSYTCAAQLSCGIAYTVQVPRGVAVRISASAGEITLTGLSGAVTARTDAGLITADDLRSAAVSLKSNAGGIIATCSIAPLSLDASTHLGPITLTVPGTVAYKISSHTFVGTSTITVRRSATSPHEITTSSDVGSVSISPG
jgi:hypothetical protein